MYKLVQTSRLYEQIVQQIEDSIEQGALKPGERVRHPDLGEGVKVALHHQGEITSPESLDRDVRPEEAQAMRDLVSRFMPEAAGALLDAVVCMYTDTPDLHFLIGRHPEHGSVHIISPCSGHGFKFSSAIGEIVADAVAGNPSRFDLSAFALARFRG